MNEEKFIPGRGEFLKSFSNFRAACRAGMTALYHAPDFVAMDRASYNRLCRQKQERVIEGVLFSEDSKP